MRVCEFFRMEFSLWFDLVMQGFVVFIEWKEFVLVILGGSVIYVCMVIKVGV